VDYNENGRGKDSKERKHPLARQKVLSVRKVVAHDSGCWYAHGTLDQLRGLGMTVLIVLFSTVRLIEVLNVSQSVVLGLS
jgi:hypothetical protein